MRVIAIEEHWTTEGIDRALRAQPAGARDESVALNDRGDIPARLLDIGEQRVEEMDAAGVDLQILSIAPPGTHGLPAREAIALSPMRVIDTLAELVDPDGTIAIMSSGQGSIANNERGGFEIYRASKSALNQLMRSYAARHRNDPARCF